MKNYRVGKAFGGPSHSVRKAVKKILKKAKAKKDTESVRDVRAGGGRTGFRVGSSVGRHLKKGVELLKEHAAKKEAKKVQAGKDKIQKSEMGYAKGGKADKN